MNILIIGCSRVGAQLALSLEKMGHTVSVVDEDPNAFRLLDGSFSGYTTAGAPTDGQVLRSAGIDGCDGVAAVTDDDNTNIMVGQMARELYHVPKVVARVMDHSREAIFSRFALPTVCPTNLSVEALTRALDADGSGETQQLQFDCASVSFSQFPVPRSWVGHTTDELTSQEQ